jgi:glutathione S-transferase
MGIRSRAEITGLAEVPVKRRRHFSRQSGSYGKAAPRSPVAGESFSAADITTLVTIDFAARALGMSIPPGCIVLQLWYDGVAARPSATAQEVGGRYEQDHARAVQGSRA